MKLQSFLFLFCSFTVSTMRQRVMKWAVVVAALLNLSAVQVLSQSNSQAISPDNLQALLAIKAALVDPYGALVSWNATGLPGACSGSWVGVKCSQGTVVALQLPGRGLGGSIPDEVGQLAELRHLNLNSNSIVGSIPEPLARLHKLRALYLSANLLSGVIPSGLGINSAVLQAIDLSQNQLIGPIPMGLTNSSKLMLLNLSSNHLSGTFSQEWSISLSLIALDVSNNYLAGSLPSSWGSRSSSMNITPQLHYLDASHNLLTGSIPSSLSALGKLKQLNLMQNQIAGSIPSELGQLMALERLYLSDNALSGSIPSQVGDLNRLSVLDLSRNNLSGVLPSSLGSLKSLRTLNVSRNKLAGSIPIALADVPLLVTLDISCNDLNGSIPAALAQLDNLTTLNLSNNYLQGAIPPFKYPFNLSSFAGNAGLCGYIASLSPCSPPSAPFRSNSPSQKGQPTAAGSPHQHLHPQQQVRRTSHFGIVTILCIAISSAMALSTAACMVLFLLWRSARPTKHGNTDGDAKDKNEEQKQSGDSSAAVGKLVLFDGAGSFTANDLLCATAEVMGKSAYGTDYKATLENGSAITVKRLREGIVKNQVEFETEVNTLGRIRHPYLLALRAYYWGPKNEKLLLFDYMPGGSLAAFLHARGPEKPLGWSTRARIAAGTARGLHYLHEQEKIIHGNLTSSVILLDSNLNATISEFGLARLMTSAASSHVVTTARALGYRAPELAKSNNPTTQSDVYSFGIVLLELLTGRAPGESFSSDGGVMDLPDFVSSVEEEDWTFKVFDADLMERSGASTEADLLNTLQMALKCVALSPSSRPDVAQVMHHLEEVAQ
ncbi:hypothetical protein O6H91_11G051000 [Diphasiastrum complanatum]|uniref:Uncharacterized protein n=1 Tax=Diphasiastrum complanatum TaxID=34168 RepID=A0ACC2C8Z3_DIPCM|nr:hypothetical protein O6H91_11G051000 [Diphasiastrum complanatum]